MVDLPKGKEPIGYKWVFFVKLGPNGIVERYKTRLVVRGYTQTYGVEYHETLSSIAKTNSIRILISVVAN